MILWGSFRVVCVVLFQQKIWWVSRVKNSVIFTKKVLVKLFIYLYEDDDDDDDDAPTRRTTTSDDDDDEPTTTTTTRTTTTKNAAPLFFFRKQQQQQQQQQSQGGEFVVFFNVFIFVEQRSFLPSSCQEAIVFLLKSVDVVRFRRWQWWEEKKEKDEDEVRRCWWKY